MYLYGDSFQKSMDQPGMVDNPCRRQLDRESYLSLSPFARSVRIWSRDTGSTFRSHVSSLILIIKLNLMLTREVPRAFRDGVTGNTIVYR